MPEQTMTFMKWILPIGSEEASLEIAGGKGANLCRLARASFPVPDGFLVTTAAYQAFVDANSLGSPIQNTLSSLTDIDPIALEKSSEKIRSFFAQGTIPEELAGTIADAYHQQGNPAVAVRSSATAEDLPGMSFAGQQDTFLNVIGEKQLIQAIIGCWSSLWTARAIGYRLHNHLSHSNLSIAVVVQAMVESQISGVMFTANPLTGLRSETVIDASFGLGEAIVSGKVEPDHYVANSSTGQIIQVIPGSKALSIHGQAGGGTVINQETSNTVPALSDHQILVLTQIGKNVEQLFDSFPQDIEFAWSDGKPYLLQARPITSLFPMPVGMPLEPLQVLFSFAAVQGVLDPITPLGREIFRLFAVTGARLFGSWSTLETQKTMATAGERLWVNFTGLVRNSVGRRIAQGALGYVEPTIKKALLSCIDDPRLVPEKTGISLKLIPRLSRFFVPLFANGILNLLFPAKRREWILRKGESKLAILPEKYTAIRGDRWQKLGQIIDITENTMLRMGSLLVPFISGVAAGMASFVNLNNLANSLPKENGENWKNLVLEMTRGLPHNPTSEMDLTLWKISREIKADPRAAVEFDRLPAHELARRFLDGLCAETTLRAVRDFLRVYGLRGLAEIDLGRERWIENPTHVFEILGGYLKLDNPELAPDLLFRNSIASHDQILEQLCQALRKTRGGWFKVPLARFFASRVKELMGLRESPKFFMVRLFGLVRQEILMAGKDFVKNGEMDLPDDLVYLTFAEIREFSRKESKPWKQIIAHRREIYMREMLRRNIPKLILSDGRVFYGGIEVSGEEKEGILNGSPVSPGTADGFIRVVYDPRQAQLQPGEILVCPGTDPSWTPLFLTAAGLVMEVGGMMTHGAVVAREFGIPAIVGVERATQRLRTGQRIRIDGSTGLIEILD